MSTRTSRPNIAVMPRSCAPAALTWTVLAAPFLTDDPATGEVATAVDAKAAGRSLTRADYAAALLDALDRSDWVGHIVGVANP